MKHIKLNKDSSARFILRSRVSTTWNEK